MTQDAHSAEVEKLKAEIEALKQNKPVSLKVSEKGAVSVYGLGRFPVTLYREQWDKLLGQSEQIKAFIHENKERLKTRE